MLQEIAVVLLDVGPLMSPIRQFAGQAICGFLQSKVCCLSCHLGLSAVRPRTPFEHVVPLSQMLNRPTHEVEVVYYGTTGVILVSIVCVSALCHLQRRYDHCR